MIESLSRYICQRLGYHLAPDIDDGTLILFSPSGHWDYWRPTSRWSRLLRWHVTQIAKGN